jgi:hypothetical protein
MKPLKQNQNGFIPMLVLLLLVIAAVIIVAFIRVHHASQ